MQTILERTGYDPEQNADNGNRFLTANGYLGVRGTAGEFGPDEQTAVNLAGIYHQKGSGWREPLNAPNPFYIMVEGASLLCDAKHVERHCMSVDIADGVFRRETTFSLPGGHVTLKQERFCCMEQVHMLAHRVTLCADHDCTLCLHAGIDTRIWELHGPHYQRMEQQETNGQLVLNAITDDDQQVCVAWRSTLPPQAEPDGPGLYRWQILLHANQPYSFDAFAAIYTSSDSPTPAEDASAALAALPDYEVLLQEQRTVWKRLWQSARVEIEGDARAEFAINTSLYHLISIAPRHSSSLSVPARGLSGQTYKGAIFWDTEMFMLDSYLCAMPQVAKSTLRYRIDTLPGALDKARNYGLQGAFYAWESQTGGIDGCSDYNVTDVFTGRPMRTYFRDRQVHISAAIVYGLVKYYDHTGDDSLMREGGATVIWECARFYLSLLTKRIHSDVYDLNDVVGPDEYHERVNNNAYTNEMVRMVFMKAVELCPHYLGGLDQSELAAFADAAKRLKRQSPDPETNLIPQFDGYFTLEDSTPEQVRARLLDPREYWGGAYGVAASTQVIKQADVIAMLCMLPGYSIDVMAANYDYYEPRTEHGSSLSACMYALCACRLGRPDAAYPLFLQSAEADIRGGGKQWAGLIYIGGTHPAAAGGAYMVLLRGFLGLSLEDGEPKAKGVMPNGWRRVRLPVWYRGRRYVVTVSA